MSRRRATDPIAPSDRVGIGACPHCAAPLSEVVRAGRTFGYTHAVPACREFLRLGLIPTLRELADRR